MVSGSINVDYSLRSLFRLQANLKDHLNATCVLGRPRKDGSKLKATYKTAQSDKLWWEIVDQEKSFGEKSVTIGGYDFPLYKTISSRSQRSI